MAKSPEPPAVDAAAETREACGVCARPPVVCVCDRVTALKTRRRLLILQHPREKDEILGSAQILTASLPKARLAVGLSWRGLKHALGEESARGGSWAVLYPDRSGSRPGGGKARGPAKGPLARVENRRGRAVDPAGLEGLIALDGTWPQAKSLWWRNPWLRRLPRMTLDLREPSIYGRLRPEPSRRHVSTLEAAAAALTACGESAEVETALRRIFRTLVQRCRDAPDLRA